AIEGVDKKLGNKKFVERADPDVVASERERADQLRVELEMLKRNLSGF
ncbi:MAG: valyl-tRNA synthetase, partial [Planctomycetota bacterium]